MVRKQKKFIQVCSLFHFQVRRYLPAYREMEQLQGEKYRYLSLLGEWKSTCISSPLDPSCRIEKAAGVALAKDTEKSTPLSVGQEGQNQQHLCTSNHSRSRDCFSLLQPPRNPNGRASGLRWRGKKKLKRNLHRTMFYGAEIPQRFLFICFQIVLLCTSFLTGVEWPTNLSAGRPSSPI